VSKNLQALIRYRIIDKCLRKRNKFWTLSELAIECSDALSEISGTDIIPHNRTIAGDIFIMRGGDLGYDAPIVFDRLQNGYTYEDKDFSIQQGTLNPNELKLLKEGISTLRQFIDIKGLEELFQLVKTVERKIHINEDENQFIYLDSSHQYTGHKFINPILSALRNGEILMLTYLPFGWSNELNFKFQPFFLKEYNNRWFVFGRNLDEERVYNYALDRIVMLEEVSQFAIQEGYSKLISQLNSIIGVTIPDPFNIIDLKFKISKHRASYIQTKPIHSSQKLLKEESDFLFFQVSVAVNKELISTVLSYGKDLIIESPDEIKLMIKKILIESIGNYEEPKTLFK